MMLTTLLGLYIAGGILCSLAGQIGAARNPNIEMNLKIYLTSFMGWPIILPLAIMDALKEERSDDQ